MKRILLLMLLCSGPGSGLGQHNDYLPAPAWATKEANGKGKTELRWQRPPQDSGIYTIRVFRREGRLLVYHLSLRAGGRMPYEVPYPLDYVYEVSRTVEGKPWYDSIPVRFKLLNP